MNNSIFYTYLYKDPKTDVPLYVGKGQDYRAFSHFKSKHHLGNLLRKRNREGYVCDPIFLHKDCTENQSFAFEIFWIAVFGRQDLDKGTLLNRTNGGEGPSGIIWSEETKNS